MSCKKPSIEFKVIKLRFNVCLWINGHKTLKLRTSFLVETGSHIVHNGLNLNIAKADPEQLNSRPHL